MEPKEVIFDSIIFRPNYAVKAFYYNPATFERVPAGREFYAGDILHITDEAGDENDPGGIVWEVQGRNSEGILYRVWIQPMANDWGRKPNTIQPAVIPPNQDQYIALDPADYMGWLFAITNVDVWPTMGKGTPKITTVEPGYAFKQINQPDWAEVEWQGHTAFVEMSYTAPQLMTGQYYPQVVAIDEEPIQDIEYKPDPPDPDPAIPLWQIIADWCYTVSWLTWLGDLLYKIFDK